jgi:effector-binding domain-containing protein
MQRETLPPVCIQLAGARAIACAHATIPPASIPRVFANHLDKVYDAARKGICELDGQNIFVYRKAGGGNVDVQFGVGARNPFAAVGEVTYANLPTGRVATATHWGDYSRIGEAHAAVTAWCHEHGHALEGTSWEIYGHWNDDPAKRRTDVYYLLA